MSVRPGLTFGFGVAFGAVVAGRLETGFGAVGFGLDVGLSESVRVGVSGTVGVELDSETVLEFESGELFVSATASIVGEGTGVA